MALTIKDIAKETGYAISTVSRALNDRPDVSEEAKRKIRAVVEARGFVPNSNAKQLKQQTAKAICIIVKGRSNLLFATIVEEMQQCIEKAGYAAILDYVDEDANEVAEAKRFAAEQKPQGFVFLGGNLENFRQSFMDVTLPSVLVTNSAVSLGFENLSSVSTDDSAGASMAISHLLACGHTHIGVLGGNIDISYTSRLRYYGCLQSFSAAGMPFDAEKQFQKARFSYSSAYKNMKKLVEKYPEMTAVFTMGDVMSIGAVRALRDLDKRVPEDVSVIGFDGIELTDYYNPKLATIRQGSQQLASRGVEIIVDRISRGTAATHEVIPCTLVEGESVRCKD